MRGPGFPEVPANVRFTGFLPTDAYYALMASSHAVMCLTTRNHTMQRGACEALWMGRPIITSAWPVLQNYFSGGTVHVQNTADAIRHGVEEMVRSYPRHAAEIKALRTKHRLEWRTAVSSLVELLDNTLAVRGTGSQGGSRPWLGSASLGWVMWGLCLLQPWQTTDIRSWVST